MLKKLRKLGWGPEELPKSHKITKKLKTTKKKLENVKKAKETGGETQEGFQKSWKSCEKA